MRRALEGNLMRLRRFACLILCCVFQLAASLQAAGQDVVPHRQDRLPNRPYSPAEAIESMTVPAGFSVELVASEPDLVNPIAMCFDDRGRIWVTESLEYPRKEAGIGRDRVKILEDTDSDGKADRITVFAGGLNIPTGVAVGFGGVWVLNAPDLLFLREKDGRELSREVVLTGFGRADAHELPSTLTWGPDGWLYGLNGVFNPSLVRSHGKEFRFTCAMWRVHPRTHEFQVYCEGTSNPYGIAWDTEGSTLVEACHWANDHLFHFVETGYYKRQAGAYPPYTLKIGAISDHGHQKTAYCGLVFLDSDAYPRPYRERLYTGNIHGNCINRDVLARDGSTYIARAEPDFLVAHDAWFMPVAQKVGPDGCLYILDWYDRYHCYQDASRDPGGVDRLKGRLYRVRYGESPRAPRFDLAAESNDALIQRLASPNIYFRETAERLLAERNTPSILRRLEGLVLDESHPRKARMHALWALTGTGTLEESFHARLLDHPDSGYRAWGVRAAGNQGRVSSLISTKVAERACDRARDVQLQVAIAARKVENLDPVCVLVDVLSACGEDRLIPSIVWPNLHPLLLAEGDRFTRLIAGIDLNTAPALARLLPQVVDRVVALPGAGPKTIRAIVERLVRQDVALAQACFAVVSDRIKELPESSRSELRTQLKPTVEEILAAKGRGSLYHSAQLLASRLAIGSVDPRVVSERVLASDESDQVRLQALDALISLNDSALPEVVRRLLGAGSIELLRRALAMLGRSDHPAIAQVLLAQYPSLDPELQPLAINLLLERETWARKLLDAVLALKLPRNTLDANHLRKILGSNDREAIWAVEKAWGSVREERNPERANVVSSWSKYLRQNPGDPKAGQAVFRKLCAQCHAIYGEGIAVGPDLTSNGRASFDQLVSSVFDPSQVIGPAYQTTTVVTEDGRNLTGLVTEDSNSRIMLVLPGGAREAVARNNVKFTRVSKLSMMPEGIESLLDRKALSDLFAFLALDHPPGDARARLIPGAPRAVLP
jgi:putative membrane-bound dehydrogenase-like protein